jgi:hypothetical protein
MPSQRKLLRFQTARPIGRRCADDKLKFIPRERVDSAGHLEAIGGISVIGKLLAEGMNKLKESGLGHYANTGAETRSTLRITRQYMDSLTIEARTIDAVEASTEFELFGEGFATPVMTGALSGLGAICPNPMVEMAKGVKAAGAMWVGIGVNRMREKPWRPERQPS